MKKFIKILLLFLFSIIALLAFTIPLNIFSTNWYNQYLPNLNNRPLSDITFIDSLLGFAVTGDNTIGDTNYIIRTTNGGDNWIKLDSVYGDISRIIFINSNTGYICGGWRPGIPGGFVSKTTNSGINWNILPSSIFANHFDDMYLLNKDTIFVVDDNGFDGGVYRTTNGGNNWEHLFGSPSILPQKIYMFNQNLGFFSTNFVFGYLYRTTNGGFNWTKIGDELGFSQITFIDSMTGWKAAYKQMKKSTDGGLNWINQPLPNPSVGYISNGMYHFSIINKDTIWGGGGSYQYPNNRNRAILYRTTNGGLNWYFQIPDTGLIKNFGAYNLIQFSNKLVGWAYEFNGIHTINGGDTTFVSIHQISDEIPKEYELYQNYPNPFNQISNIKYQISKKSFVTLTVFDILGKKIITLVNSEQQSGTYKVDFIGDNYSSGIYFYKIEVQTGKDYFSDTKKMLMIK